MPRHLGSAIGALAVLLTWSHGFLHAQVAAPSAEARYIPDKALFGLIVRPSGIVKNPEIQKLYKLAQSMPGGLFERDLGVQLADIDLAVIGVTLPGSLEQPGGTGVPSIVLRMKDAATMKAISEKIVKPDLEKKTLPGTNVEVLVYPKPNIDRDLIGGTKKPRDAAGEYEAKVAEAAKSPDAWKTCVTFYFPDDRTMVFSPHGAVVANIAEQLKPGASAPAWAKQYDSAARFPLAVYVDVKQARELLKALTGGAAPPGQVGMVYNMVAPLWEKSDQAVIALDTGDGLKFTIVAHSPDDDSAKSLKGTLDGLIALGKGMVLPLIKAEAPKLDIVKPGLGMQLYGDLEKSVNEMSVTNSGTMTIVKFAIPQQTLATITSTIIPFLDKAAEGARQNMGINNLKMISIGMLNHHDAYRTLPAAARIKKEGQPPHSWRVALLPMIEEEALYRQYKFDEPWDSEANKKVLAQMPEIYRAPNADPKSTNTSYVVPILDKGIFTATPALKGLSMLSIKDGLSRTIIVIETETSIPWTKPEDLVIDPTKPLPALGFAKSPTLNVVFADGSAHRFIKNPTIELLLPFLTASGEDVGDLEKLRAPSPAGMMPPRPAGVMP